MIRKKENEELKRQNTELKMKIGEAYHAGFQDARELYNGFSVEQYCNDLQKKYDAAYKNGFEAGRLEALREISNANVEEISLEDLEEIEAEINNDVNRLDEIMANYEGEISS